MAVDNKYSVEAGKGKKTVPQFEEVESNVISNLWYVDAETGELLWLVEEGKKPKQKYKIYNVLPAK